MQHRLVLRPPSSIVSVGSPEGELPPESRAIVQGGPHSVVIGTQRSDDGETIVALTDLRS